MGTGPLGGPVKRLGRRFRTRYATAAIVVAVGAALTVSSVSLAS